MIKIPITLCLGFLALTIGACARTPVASSGQEGKTSCCAHQCPMQAKTEGQRPGCPMGLEGTSVRAENLDEGAALVFSTTGDVQALQSLIEAKAQWKNTHHGCHPGCAHTSDAPCAHKGHHPDKPEVKIQAVNTADGARLEFRAEDQTAREAIRQRIQRRAEKMNHCPMGQKKPGAKPQT